MIQASINALRPFCDPELTGVFYREMTQGNQTHIIAFTKWPWLAQKELDEMDYVPVASAEPPE